MPVFQLTEPYGIDGSKLAAEITRNKDIPFNPSIHEVIFHPPQTVEIVGLPEEYDDLVAGIVARHHARYTLGERLRKIFRR